jgi:hypothetical protein
MRITITIDTDTSDIKVDIPPVKPEVPLPNDYITPVFSEYN